MNDNIVEREFGSSGDYVEPREGFDKSQASSTETDLGLGDKKKLTGADGELIRGESVEGWNNQQPHAFPRD